jgi:acyl-CoA synthetase (AMP-forming)/AMP-acid ligase II/aryl carrier-like protein
MARVLRDSPPEHLVNGYGPTETTTFAITHEITEVAEGAKGIPIGRPIANTQAYVLDSHGEAVPVGVAGDIYIGGAGLGHGYLNGPVQTAERFVPCPYSTVAGARMYKTGDLGRYQADGKIEFLGRNDFQVKIRGFRIELGEIEARLARHPGIGEVVVMKREDSPGEIRLVAYYTLARKESGRGAESARKEESEEPASVVSAETLRKHILGALPEYMAPAAYVELESLPLTANGKLDRKALPRPGGKAHAAREYEAPKGETEVTLAKIWAELLKLERVGRHDHFFELGGHSLLAVSLIERMRGEGLHADVRALFVTPTLAELAAVAEKVWRL